MNETDTLIATEGGNPDIGSIPISQEERDILDAPAESKTLKKKSSILKGLTKAKVTPSNSPIETPQESPKKEEKKITVKPKPSSRTQRNRNTPRFSPLK